MQYYSTINCSLTTTVCRWEKYLRSTVCPKNVLSRKRSASTALSNTVFWRNIPVAQNLTHLWNICVLIWQRIIRYPIECTVQKDTIAYNCANFCDMAIFPTSVITERKTWWWQLMFQFEIWWNGTISAGLQRRFTSASMTKVKCCVIEQLQTKHSQLS